MRQAYKECVVCQWQGVQVPAAVTCHTCCTPLCLEHGELHEELFEVQLDWSKP